MPDPDPDAVRYARMRWNTPLSEEHAELLLRRLDVPTGARVLDLGCGWGELLLRAVAAAPGATGIGIDSDERALERGRALADDRGLAERVTFVHRDAAAWTPPADRVLCVGASHAWDGADKTLHALVRLVEPGGRLLFGDGCWEQRPPTPAASAIFGDEVFALSELAEHAIAAGWRLSHVSTADQREWDDFESTWRAGREEWLLGNPDDERAPDIRSELDAQLREYLSVYRGVLGFAYLVVLR